MARVGKISAGPYQLCIGLMMAISCLLLLFVTSVFLAALALYFWAVWTRRHETDSYPEPPVWQLPLEAPAQSGPPRQDSGSLPSGIKVAEDELAYLWTENDERRESWRTDPSEIPQIEDLRDQVAAALESGDRKEIALAKAALADALDPSRLNIE